MTGSGDWEIADQAPAGDVDGDGRTDLFLRLAKHDRDEPDRVVVIRGGPIAGGAIDIADPIANM